MFNRLIWESKGGASPTTVDRVPYKGLSLLLVLSFTPRGFSPVSPLLINQHFQIPIRSGTHGHVEASS